MPQMSPMVWVVYPVFMMLMVVVGVVTLSKEGLDISVEDVGEVDRDGKVW